MKSRSTGPPPAPKGEAGQDLWIANRVLEQLIPCLDLDDLLVQFHALVQDLLPHEAGLVATVAPGEPRQLKIAAAHGFNGALARLPPLFAPAALIDPWDWTAGSLRIPDLTTTRVQLGDLLGAGRWRSLLGIPLAAGGDTLAVLVLVHRQPAVFAAIPDTSLEQLRRAVALPLANAQRFTAQQRDARALIDHAVQWWDVVGAGTDLSGGLLQLLDQARALVDADAGTIMAVVAENDELYVRASSGMQTRATADALLPWGTRAAAPLRALAGPQLLPGLRTAGAPPAVRAAAAEGFDTYLGLPVGDAQSHPARGLLTLYWRRPLRALDADTQMILQGLAHAVAALLANNAQQLHYASCDRVVEQFHQHKARMLSLIGHQLRTPITSISGYAQLMLRRAEPGSSAVRYADTILQESRRMGYLIDNVLELSRLEEALIALRLHPFDLHALLADLRGDPTWCAVAGAPGLAWHLPDTIPIVVGDPLRLKQALLALLRRVVTQDRRAPAPVPILARLAPAGAPTTVEIVLGAAHPTSVVPTDADPLAGIDLRNAVDSQTAQDDELALYAALQLLAAMGADLRITRDAAGQTAYVVALPLLEELHLPGSAGDAPATGSGSGC
ncbi:MAG TPA: histidine kinase dimerization/phospho-acceptor domain-containing protein [Chloroflexia bacterium]|nr:histidine kinase dimerization/phospho-acceptor domain-containing protein [Chloroflexia bacterium]